MPVLTIAGDQSLGEKMEAGLQKYSSNLQATVLKNCGHYVPEEKPQEVTRLIRNFLAIDCDRPLDEAEIKISILSHTAPRVPAEIEPQNSIRKASASSFGQDCSKDGRYKE